MAQAGPSEGASARRAAAALNVNMVGGMRGVRAVGDWAIDAEVTTRGYTTRAKEEQRRTAAPVFTGRVRKWEKRWSLVGHMAVLRWERVEADAAGGAPPAPPAAAAAPTAAATADDAGVLPAAATVAADAPLPPKRERDDGADGDAAEPAAKRSRGEEPEAAGANTGQGAEGPA